MFKFFVLQTNYDAPKSVVCFKINKKRIESAVT
jgi:hypothetical protein